MVDQRDTTGGSVVQKRLPFGRDHHSLRAILLAAKAYCEIRTGAVDSGLSSAAAASEIVRSGKIPHSDQNLAWSRMGELGVNLARAGHPKPGIQLLLETISQLELAGAHCQASPDQGSTDSTPLNQTRGSCENISWRKRFVTRLPYAGLVTRTG